MLRPYLWLKASASACAPFGVNVEGASISMTPSFLAAAIRSSTEALTPNPLETARTKNNDRRDDQTLPLLIAFIEEPPVKMILRSRQNPTTSAPRLYSRKS